MIRSSVMIVVALDDLRLGRGGPDLLVDGQRKDLVARRGRSFLGGRPLSISAKMEAKVSTRTARVLRLRTLAIGDHLVDLPDPAPVLGVGHGSPGR